jgi:fused signal recognition particle receptor
MALFKSVMSKIARGLGRTRDALVGSLRSALLGKRLDEALIGEIEARLLQADVGVKTTARLVEGIRTDFRAGKLERGEDALDYLKRELKAMWPEADRRLHIEDRSVDGRKAPTVILVAGINGAGKTTSVAKLAKAIRDEGRTVLLGACDTFRAGAVRQLEIWSQRIGVELVRGQEGGDPAAVAFDACDAALARASDVLILDTAGRLHTQDPLMRQLTKIRDVAAKRIPGAPHEVLLVLDATTGQNAVRQAEEFTRAIGVTGLFVAKLDGTAKGGAVLSIRDTLDVPVKFIGVGETLDDVEPFDPKRFVEALFEAPAEAEAETAS